MMLKRDSVYLLLLPAAMASANHRPLKVDTISLCTTLVLGFFSSFDQDGQPFPGCGPQDDPFIECPNFFPKTNDYRYLYDCRDIAMAPAEGNFSQGLLTEEYGSGPPTGRVGKLEPLAYLSYMSDTSSLSSSNQDDQDILRLVLGAVPLSVAIYANSDVDYVLGQVRGASALDLFDLVELGEPQAIAVADSAGLVKDGKPKTLIIAPATPGQGFKTIAQDSMTQVVIDNTTGEGWLALSIKGQLKYGKKGYNALKKSEIQHYLRSKSITGYGL